MDRIATTWAGFVKYRVYLALIQRCILSSLPASMSGPDDQGATSHIQMQSVFYSIRAVELETDR